MATLMCVLSMAVNLKSKRKLTTIRFPSALKSGLLRAAVVVTVLDGIAEEKSLPSAIFQSPKIKPQITK